MKQTKKFAAMLLSMSALFGASCASQQPKPVFRIPQVYSAEHEKYREIVEKVDNTLVKDNHPKKVDLEILVDDAYIKKYGSNKEEWWEQLKQSVLSWSGERFNKSFGIELEIDSVKYIRFDDESDDAGYLFSQVKLEHDPNECDAILTFTGKPYATILGLAIRKGNHALVFSDADEPFTTQHEVSHLFNAFDIYECDYNWWDDITNNEMHPIFFAESIMSYNPLSKSDIWDRANTLRINNAKNRSWEYSSEHVQKTRDTILKFPKERQLEALKLVCFANATRYDLRGEELAKRLCTEFPKDWQLKYLHSLIKDKDEANPLKVVELAKLYKEIIDLNPDAETLNNLAWDMVAEHGHINIGGVDYLEIAKKSVELKAEDYNLDTLGYIYYRQKDYNNAIKYLKRASEKTESLEVVMHLAMAYYAKDDLPNFRSAVKKMITVEPEEGLIHYNYSAALMHKFRDRLGKTGRNEALDMALASWDIYPCKKMADLVEEAYLFNSESWTDKKFMEKYEKKIIEIIGGNKK